MSSLIGREAELELLRTRLRNFAQGARQNLALLGRAGLGKTTLLCQALTDHGTLGCDVIYVDLAEVEPATMVRRLVAAVEPFLKSPTEAIREHLRLAKDQLEQRAVRTAAQHALHLIPLMIRANRRKVILALDEFHRLTQAGLGEVVGELGSQIMMEPNLLVIVASSEPEEAKRLIGEELSYLFGDFETVLIQPLTPEAADCWLEAVVPGQAWDPTAKRFALALTDGIPWYLDLVTQAVTERASAEGVWDAEAVAEGLLRLLEPPSGVVHWYGMQRLQRWLGPKPRVGMDELVIALSERPAGPAELSRVSRVSPADVKTWLERGAEAGLVSRNGGTWWLADPLLALWVVSVYAVWKGGDQSWPRARRQACRERLLRAMTHFADRAQQGPAAAMREVLDRISGSRLEIEGKRRQIPKFVEIQDWQRHADLFLARDHTAFWLYQVIDAPISEETIHAFAQARRQTEPSPQEAIVVTPHAVTPDVRVLAKERGVWIWDRSVLRSLWKMIEPLTPW